MVLVRGATGAGGEESMRNSGMMIALDRHGAAGHGPHGMVPELRTGVVAPLLPG